MSQKGHPLLPASFSKARLCLDTTVNVFNALDVLLTK